MDTMTTLFIAGAFLLVIGTVVKETTKKTRTYLQLGGLLLCVIAVVAWSGVSFGEEAPPASVAAEFTVTASESHSYVSVDNPGQTITWTVEYSHATEQITSGAQATITFSIDRGLGTVGLVQTSCSVTTIPSVTNSSTSQSFSILSKTGDQYNALWTRSGGTSAYKSIAVTIAEDADGATVALNLTLNNGAVDAMDVYDGTSIGLSVAGETWAVSVMLVDNSP